MNRRRPLDRRSDRRVPRNVTFPADNGTSRSSATIAPGTTAPMDSCEAHIHSGIANCQLNLKSKILNSLQVPIFARASHPCLSVSAPRRAPARGGYSFDIIVAADLDERVRTGESAEAYVRRFATENERPPPDHSLRGRVLPTSSARHRGRGGRCHSRQAGG